MNYPFLLKFSSITNLSDARYAAGMWADFIGFSFDPSSPSYLEPNKAKEIAGWVNGPLLVGEFGHQPKEWIMDFVNAIPLHAIQIPSDYGDATITEIDLPIILRVTEATESPLWKVAKCLITSDAQLADILKTRTELPVLFESPDAAVLNDLETYSGVAFCGLPETSPGTRNHDEWTRLLEKYMD
ncbi:MAG: hypothetical protein V4613_08150 [Bacteroidota bacterium]